MSTETFKRPTPFGCTPTAPNASALRTPSQCATGCGAFQRSGPSGGAPKGTPLNTRMPSGEFAAGAINPSPVRTASVEAAGRITTVANVKATQTNANLVRNP